MFISHDIDRRFTAIRLFNIQTHKHDDKMVCAEICEDLFMKHSLSVFIVTIHQIHCDKNT